MTEQENRVYAADLLHRAGLDFDASDVATVAKVVELVEADIANALKPAIHYSVNPVVREVIDSGIRSGAHRPSHNASPISEAKAGAL